MTRARAVGDRMSYLRSISEIIRLRKKKIAKELFSSLSSVLVSVIRLKLSYDFFLSSTLIMILKKIRVNDKIN